jgi:hypothetical protein
MSRCPWAIQYGVTLHTRCIKDAGHENNPNTATHMGRGLREFPDQTIRWLNGDRRQYMTHRDDQYSWDVLPETFTDESLREFMERGPEV